MPHPTRQAIFRWAPVGLLAIAIGIVIYAFWSQDRESGYDRAPQKPAALGNADR